LGETEKDECQELRASPPCREEMIKLKTKRGEGREDIVSTLKEGLTIAG